MNFCLNFEPKKKSTLWQNAWQFPDILNHSCKTRKKQRCQRGDDKGNDEKEEDEKENDDLEKDVKDNDDKENDDKKNDDKENDNKGKLSSIHIKRTSSNKM